MKVFQKTGRPHGQSPSKLDDVDQADVPLTTLDATHVIAV